MAVLGRRKQSYHGGKKEGKKKGLGFMPAYPVGGRGLRGGRGGPKKSGSFGPQGEETEEEEKKEGSVSESLPLRALMTAASRGEKKKKR